MSQPIDDDWVLDEAEALLDMDGRRERLERVVADLQSGEVQPIGHPTASARIERRILDRPTR
jgi:hypothetical protein